MRRGGLERDVVDPGVYERTVGRFREAGVVLPTFAQLTEPSTIPADIVERLAAIDPDAPHPLNLFRVHWYNGPDRRERVDVPVHVVLPPELTGVPCPEVPPFRARGRRAFLLGFARGSLETILFVRERRGVAGNQREHRLCKAFGSRSSVFRLKSSVLLL